MNPKEPNHQHDGDRDKSKKMSTSKQPTSCTLCKFKSNNETEFNHHLLKSHKIILKSARNSIDYKLKNKMPREKTNFKCKRCQKTFKVSMSLRDHKVACEVKFKDIVMARLKNGQLTCLYCSDCFSSKAMLDKHLKTCSKPTVACCQLCPYTCPVAEIFSMQKHIWKEHNLICKLVKEADFLQAVNCTPYTLERVPVLDALPVMAKKNTSIIIV